MSANFLSASDIHARVDWPTVLKALGIEGSLLEIKRGKRAKNGPCPACGGTDRFFFDNRYRRGDFHCRGCGWGDGFGLLQRVHGWSFKEARQRVIDAAGLVGTPLQRETKIAQRDRDFAPAVPSARVRDLRRGRCPLDRCPDAIGYLESRGLWPLPTGCNLWAHPSVAYWSDGDCLGRYPALIADVEDVTAELVTAHVTYLEGGQKFAQGVPRKLLGPLTDRAGSVVRLWPAGDLVGIAEGIETALAASILHSVPVWAALNTSLLSTFEPPPSVRTLVVYGDCDVPGLLAAHRLREHLERLGRSVRVTLKEPPAPAKDWNDALLARKGNI